MRILHTGDWHIGRSLHGVSLIEDQRYLLSQFMELAKEEEPDVVVVAGDIYDRAVPPPDAVALLDEVLSELILGLERTVVIVAGNHDSPRRMEFGARLFKSGGLHIFGEPQATPTVVTVEDKHGPVHIYPLPYAPPEVVRHRLGVPEIQGHESAVKALVNMIRHARPAGERAVLVGHCFVSGLSQSESERPISVGGAAAVSPSVFEGFDYVALGHLHRPQRVTNAAIHYAGSLMRYSFSEVDHDKAVLIADMNARGKCEVRRATLEPRRNLRCLKGTLQQVLEAGEADATRDDYIMVTLEDDSPVFDAMGRLRQIYPNALHVSRPMAAPAGPEERERLDHRKTGDEELFAAFFEQVTGGKLTKKEADVFANVVAEVRQSQREVEA